MTKHPHIALMASMPLPAVPADGAVPDWIHLMPKPQGGKIFTADSRGPFLVKLSLEEIIAASFARADELEIDINHATYTAAPLGQRSDAYGWITEMQARDDGIWGLVRWTPEGAALVRDRAYRAISPALNVDRADGKTVLSIGNASLVNRPNLSGLAALNQESQMSTAVAKALGLSDDAGEDAILTAIGALKQPAGAVPALQSAIAEIGTAFGVQGGDAAAVVLAAKLAAKGGDTVVALQSQVTSLQAALTALTSAAARTASEAYVDGEMKRGRVGLNASIRDEFVTLHMAQPAVAEKLIGQMPVAGGALGAMLTAPPVLKDGAVALNSEQLQVATALGIDPKTYAETLKNEASE